MTSQPENVDKNKEINLVQIALELKEFFVDDEDIDEWLSTFIPGLNSEPVLLLASTDGRKKISEALQIMRYGDFA